VQVMTPSVVARFGRQAARLAAVCALATAGLFAVPAAVGTASAVTPTIDCDAASQQQTPQEKADWKTCQKLVGTSACAWNNGDGSWTIALGYRNPTTSNLYASIPSGGSGGANNSLTANNGSASDPDHISTFWTGTSTTAFTVTWSPTPTAPNVTWALMGHKYSFSTTTQPACNSKPVPIMGNMAAAALAGGLLVAGFAVVNRRRLVRLRAVPWRHRV
jgi:hypothetical protein